LRSFASSTESQRGATVVEYALVAPLLFLLIFGVIEFGRGIATYTAVSSAAREGARYAAAVGESPHTPGIPRYLDCEGIRRAAEAKVVVLDWGRTDIQVVYDSGPGTAAKTSCGAGTPSGIDKEDRVRVKVTTEFTSPIPLISRLVGELTVESEQARTIFMGENSG